MEHIKISIITPTYNAEHYIRQTVASVQAQTHENWELLVIDDCSLDATRAIIEALALNDRRIRLLPLGENSGAAVARNTGLDAATGEYVAFLDADDLWMPGKLEKQLRFMAGAGHAISFTAYAVVNAHCQATGTVVDLRGARSVAYPDMLKKKATMGCSTIMMHRATMSGFHMPLIRTGQDYGLWLRILKEGHSAFCLQEVLTQYRIVPGSISRNKFKKALRQWEIYRKLEKISLLRSSWFFLHYAYRAVSR
jgi:teichuronic acid biosynthesis glycosyltransferase TuaG